MKTSRLSYRQRRGQRGQSFLLIVMFVALLLLGVLGIATDYSQIWAHRQMAQGAADAACQAAAADLYLALQGTTYSWISSTTPFDCTSNKTSAPCQYASLNGYNGSQVNVSFPSSLPGVASLPPSVSVANAYVLVNISDSVTMGLSKLLNAGNNFTISAKAGCGLVEVSERIPLLVLNRANATTFQTGGSSNITIVGGPQRSIQVDASSSSAASVGGTVDLSKAGPNSPPSGGDFAVGGKETQPGSSSLLLGSTGNWKPSALPLPDPFASYAAPAKPTNKGQAFPVALGVNGCPDPAGCTEYTGGDYSACSSSKTQAYLANACPITVAFSSPYGNQWAGSHSYKVGDAIIPTTNNSNNNMFMATAAGTSVASPQPVWSNYGIGLTFTAGGVTWRNMGPINTSPNGANTAIFDPGVYYLGSSGLQPPSGTTVRMSTAAGDGTQGATFYFSQSASVSIGSNTGSQSSCTSVVAGTNSWTISPSKCIVQYNIDGSSTFNVPSLALRCSSGSPPNPAAVTAQGNYAGNILLGPCSGPSTADGQTTDYSGGIDTTDGFTGSSRGFLFFQSRTAAADGGSCTAGFTGKCAILGGGGSYIFSGFAYFHMNTGSTGTKCGTDISCLTYAGGAGSSSVTLGNIVIDQLSLTGTANLTMNLNSWTSFPVLKPSLLE